MAYIAMQALGVVMRYVVNNNGSLYFQRAVPRELQARYPKKLIRVPLGTSSSVDTIQYRVRQLAEDTTRMFQAMRSDAQMLPADAKRAVNMIFSNLGIKIDPNGVVSDTDIEKFEDAYAEAVDIDPTRTGAYRITQRFLHGEFALLLSECAELYLRVKGLEANTAAHNRVLRDWNRFLEMAGDQSIQTLTRDQIREFIKKRRDQGAKTGTVRRELNTLRAGTRAALLERRLNLVNPFDSIAIPNEGQDAIQRETLSVNALKVLLSQALEKMDQLRLIAILQMHTGARIGEIVGLRTQDVHFEGDVPHIVIAAHGSRALKTKGSNREVPLVGQAFKALVNYQRAQTVKNSFIFPQYASKESVRSNSASGAMAKWLRTALPGAAVSSHCFRHTLEDLLREADVPRPIQRAIGGWGESDMSDNYGKGYSLKVKKNALEKALQPLVC